MYALQEERGSFDASLGILRSLWQQTLQQTVPLLRWPTVLCSISVSILLGKFNPKIMVVVNFTIAAVAGIVMLSVASRYLILVLFCIEVILAGFSMVLINGTAVSIFPTQVCAMAVTLSMMMARLSSFIFSSVIGFFMVDHCEVTFYMFSGILIFGAALTVLLSR